MGHFPKRENILLSIVKIQNQGELQLRKRCSSIILVEAAAFHKDLRAVTSLRVCLVFFNLILSYTHLFMLKLRTFCKIPIKKLTFN